MRNLNIKTSNFPIAFGVMFTIIPLLFMAVAVGMLTSSISTKKNTDASTIATRVEIRSYWSKDSDGHRKLMYKPVFYYDVNNKIYTCASKVATNWKPNIEKPVVFYNSQNPKICMSEYGSKSDFVFSLFFLLFPSIFLFIGIPILKAGIIQSYRLKMLAKSGELIKNLPCQIVPSNCTYNGRRGYTIEIEYNGMKLESEPKFDIDARRQTADLLIDPMNSDVYFIGYDIA